MTSFDEIDTRANKKRKYNASTGREGTQIPKRCPFWLPQAACTLAKEKTLSEVR